VRPDRPGSCQLPRPALTFDEVTTVLLRAFGPVEYDSRALTTGAVHNALVILADMLAAVSLIGLVAIVYSLFIGARALAVAETDRRKA